MVGVQDIAECPKCKGEAHTEFETRTGEYNLYCPECGYRRWTCAVTDRKKEKELFDELERIATEIVETDERYWVE